MTQVELDGLMNQLVGELKAIGIPLSESIEPRVVINSRAKRRLGCCIYKNATHTIEVSDSLLKPEESKLLRQTLAHELLHTCWGCKNHGERWKSYAQRVNVELGFNIERAVHIENAERLRQDTVKYLLICKSCGKQIPRSRMSKVVKNPSRYRCLCGGKLKRAI